MPFSQVNSGRRLEVAKAQRVLWLVIIEGGHVTQYYK